MARFLFLILKVLLLLLLLYFSQTYAWEECPFGLINDTYPGECIRYVDSDNNGICDLSQLSPIDSSTNVTLYDLKYKNRTLIESDVYNFLPISLILIFFYILGSLLVKKKILSTVNHRKIWNFLLLITFLISAALGILFMIRLSLGWEIPLPFNVLFWHIESSIAMIIISIFHIIWHWPYFKKIFIYGKKYLVEKKDE